MSKLILLVDDEEDIRISLTGILEDEGYEVISAASGTEAIDTVREEVPDLVLLDIWMPGMDGLQTLEHLKNLMPDITVVMMSGHGTIETAVRATKLGAYDFIEKPFSLDKVMITVGNAMRMKDLKKENEALRVVAGRDHELVGCSPSIEKLRALVERVASTTTPLLIKGEPGSGKELVARAVHHHSLRRDKPFVSVNCASIPADLLVAELFGHEKGAFAGAAHQKRGRFDLAEGGTIFLDEVQDLPFKVQGELIRVIQEGKFERLGGSRPVSSNARLIVAAVDIEKAIKEGRFREDLSLLLDVVPLEILPLRERKEDIPFLVKHFVSHFHRREGWEPKHFDDKALLFLQEYHWPGNVRELKNIVERILIMSVGPVISADDVPAFGIETDLRDEQSMQSDKNSLQAAREQFEKQFILENLEKFGWNIDQTADAIMLERTVMHRKLVQFGLKP
jgi:two-component system, NtrC family, nitrogen regulation response regulator NtrX